MQCVRFVLLRGLSCGGGAALLAASPAAPPPFLPCPPPHPYPPPHPRTATPVPPPQERIRIPDDKMSYYMDLAEMYVGDDVSPDFYGWVFPKYDHVAVGTGTVVNKTAIKQYQQATRDRSKVKTEGGQIIRVEAHPIPGACVVWGGVWGGCGIWRL